MDFRVPSYYFGVLRTNVRIIAAEDGKLILTKIPWIIIKI